MSIFNSVAALIAGGGVEYEEGTFQGDDSITKSVYFSNTHTTAPDLVLCYYTYNGGASSALANIEYINPQGFLEGYFGSGSPYRLSLRNDGTASTQTAVNELTSTYFKLYIVPTLSHYNTYVWYAFWFNGSGGSSGGGSSGGGGEVETGEITPSTDESLIKVTFSETHSREPDIAIINTDSGSNSSLDNSGTATYILTTYDGAFAGATQYSGLDGKYWWTNMTRNGGTAGSILQNGQTPQWSAYLTNTEVQFRAYNYFQANLKYTWYAIWLDGSSSGGGGGGGGTAKNVQTNQSTSRTSSTTLTSVNSLTCTTAGTYDVYWTCDRSSTSGTWSSRLYLGGTAYGSEQTTWTNHVQTVHLSNVSISANQTVAVYVKARGTNYYGYCPQLTIVQS